MLRFIIPIASILLLSNTCFSQQIKIIDAENKQAIPNVHICTESDNRAEQHYWVTNNRGIIKNSVSRPSKVAISFIGYKTITDSIKPNQSYTFELQPDTKTINEVVVTGQITPETVDKSIYNVHVLNSIDIDNKAATNLGDLLANELNITVSNSGILGSTLKMQGLSGEHIKILIDGVPVIGRQNGNIDLGQLNLQNVDHIEIVEGPMSVIYGSNALAGAINIITKTNTRPVISTDINTYYESVGVYNLDASISTNFKKHHFNIAGGRNFFSGFNINETNERTFSFSPKQQYTGLINYGFIGKKLQFNLTQEYFNEKLLNNGSPYTSDTIYIDSIFYSFPTADDEYHYTTRLNSKANLNYKLGSNSIINLMAAYSYYDKIKNTYNKNLYYLTEQLSSDIAKHDTTFFSAINSRGTYTTKLNKLDIQGGYDLVIEKGDGKRIIETQQIGDYAGFISLKYQPFQKISFQGGARGIYNTKFKAPLVYSLNTKYNPTEDINFRASFGKGFRSPSIKELYLYFVDVNHEVKGNPELEAEYSENYSLSIDKKNNGKKHRYKVSTNIYFNKIKNKIDFLYDSINLSKADYINIDGIFRTIGGQVDFEYKLHPRFTFKTGINYYGQSKIANLNEYTYTPDYILSVNYHNLGYGFRINLYYKYNGKQSQFYEVEKEGEKQIQERYISAYNMMDLTISKPFFREQLMVSTGIKNILDIKTVESSGGASGAHSGGSGDQSSIAWGRTFFVKLNYNFTKF